MNCEVQSSSRLFDLINHKPVKLFNLSNHSPQNFSLLVLSEITFNFNSTSYLFLSVKLIQIGVILYFSILILFLFLIWSLGFIDMSWCINLFFLEIDLLFLLLFEQLLSPLLDCFLVRSRKFTTLIPRNEWLIILIDSRMFFFLRSLLLRHFE